MGVCSYCAEQLSGSYPALGKACTCHLLPAIPKRTATDVFRTALADIEQEATIRPMIGLPSNSAQALERVRLIAATALRLYRTSNIIPPEPPPAQGKEDIPTPPAAKCDGSGKMPPDGVYEGSRDKCPGCPSCKPEPKDGAEEVARKIMDLTQSSVFTMKGMVHEGAAIIRADRAARPNMNNVRELCHSMLMMTVNTHHAHHLAREVLAQLDADERGEVKRGE